LTHSEHGSANTKSTAKPKAFDERKELWGDPFCKKGLPTPLSKNFYMLFALYLQLAS